MDFNQLLNNFLAPPVPFFFLGLIAVLAKSDLEIPSQISKFISLYLLMAIGFKGGVELHHSGLNTEVMLVLMFAMIMAILTPLYAYWILRRKLDIPNAAALAAAFGSVSAVTFITASNILQDSGIAYGGEMVAAMALMESPSIIIGVLLYRKFYDTGDKGVSHHLDFKELFREAFLNGSVLLLIGSLIIGVLTGGDGWTKVHLFVEKDLFYGALMFFLLDMYSFFFLKGYPPFFLHSTPSIVF